MWHATSGGTPRSASRLDPLDLYGVSGLLTDEERMVRDSVARFVDEHVLPVIRAHFENQTFPRELVPELASLGLFGSTLEGYGCAGMNSVSYGLICQELERGDSGLRSFLSVQVVAEHVPDPRLRVGGAEGALAAAHGGGRGTRLLRAHPGYSRTMALVMSQESYDPSWSTGTSSISVLPPPTP